MGKGSIITETAEKNVIWRTRVLFTCFGIAVRKMRKKDVWTLNDIWDSQKKLLKMVKKAPIWVSPRDFRRKLLEKAVSSLHPTFVTLGSKEKLKELILWDPRLKPPLGRSILCACCMDAAMIIDHVMSLKFNAMWTWS